MRRPLGELPLRLRPRPKGFPWSTTGPSYPPRRELSIARIKKRSAAWFWASPERWPTASRRVWLLLTHRTPRCRPGTALMLVGLLVKEPGHPRSGHEARPPEPCVEV